MASRTRKQYSREAWKRLGDHVLERRTELGLTQEDIAERNGPSTTTMGFIENGMKDSYQPSSMRRLESILEWVPGSWTVVLEGGAPQLITAGLLAELLIQKRVSLGFQHRDVWCAKKRLPRDLVDAVENGRRFRLSEREVLILEIHYEVARGSIRAVLGGRASTLPAATAEDQDPVRVAFELAITEEMEQNEAAGNGAIPTWRSDDERTSWFALQNANMGPEVRTAMAAWFRSRPLSAEADTPQKVALQPV